MKTDNEIALKRVRPGRRRLRPSIPLTLTQGGLRSVGGGIHSNWRPENERHRDMGQEAGAYLQADGSALGFYLACVGGVYSHNGGSEGSDRLALDSGLAAPVMLLKEGKMISNTRRFYLSRELIEERVEALRDERRFVDGL